MGTDSVERSIGRLEGKLDSVITIVGSLKEAFDSLEKGRLSKLEVAFATLETQVSLKAQDSAKSSAMIYSIVASIISSVLAAFIVWVFVPAK